jgi:uncharacterized protein with HEPN domain
MPSEAEQGALRDILRHIDLAERFTRAHTAESFRSDELRGLASDGKGKGLRCSLD